MTHQRKRDPITNTAKGVAYAVLWLAAAVTLVRGVVGPLLGSASDYGLFGAVLAGAGGIVALAWLARVFIDDVSRGTKPENEKADTHE